MAHWTLAQLAERKSSAGRTVFYLSENDTASLPGTTKRELHGPGWAEYLFHRDGMVEIIRRDETTAVRPVNARMV